MNIGLINDLFTDLTKWDYSSGLTVSDHKTSATSDNVLGWASIVNANRTEELTATFEFIIGDELTNDRFLFIGLNNNNGAGSPGWGGGIGYVKGRGICFMPQFYNQNPLENIVGAFIADADVVKNVSYFVTITTTLDDDQYHNLTSRYAIYDQYGKYLGGGANTHGSDTARANDLITIATNSRYMYVKSFSANSGKLPLPGFGGTQPVYRLIHQTTPAVDYNQWAALFIPPRINTDCKHVCLIHAHGNGPFGEFSITEENRLRSWRAINDAALAVGYSVMIPATYDSNVAAAGQNGNSSWGSDQAINAIRQFMIEYAAEIQDVYGVETVYILYGYSMGSTIVGRLLNGGTPKPVIGAYIDRGAIRLDQMWDFSPGLFRLEINAAYGINPPDLAGATAALATKDPYLAFNADGWRNKIIYTTDYHDYFSQFTAALVADKLTPSGITVNTETLYAGHGDPQRVAHVQSFIQAVDAFVRGEDAAEDLHDGVIAAIDAQEPRIATNTTFGAPISHTAGSGTLMPEPSSENGTIAYTETIDGKTSHLANIIIQFQLLDTVVASNGLSLSRGIFEGEANDNGQLAIELRKQTKYRARRQYQSYMGEWVYFTTGTDDTYLLPPILSGADA